MNKGILIVLFGLFAVGCVPKTQYEDQRAKLEEMQAKLRSIEASNVECDKDLFLQLKEQAQSMDLLTQELVDRNTELSKEVSRLKVIESQAKIEGEACDRKMAASVAEYEAKLERTRETYEDLIKQLKAENKQLKESLEKSKSEGSKSKAKNSTPKATKH